ncbi:hypothetical protein [Krasilnikovia sp. MM14-A1004]|uniref:hypothetical protein n=1 Tax=Krasilnikovia sp. MM14-A1004 TaxID=3373541 RepID=UPI00399D15F7
MSTTALAVLGIAVALMASLFAAWQAQLVRQQLRHAERIAKAQFHQSLTQSTAEMHRIFLDRPELRPLFYENKIASDGTEHQRALAMAGFIVDLAEGCIAAEPALTDLYGDWDDHMHFLYSRSPAIREFWKDFGHLYPEGVRRALTGRSARPKAWPPHMVSSASDETGADMKSAERS